MINATPTLPTASAQPPKDVMTAAKPAPAMKPKPKTNWKFVGGLIVLVLVIAGAAAGFYMTQMGGFDLRQQAAVEEPPPTSGCGGTTTSGTKCLSTQFASGNVCTNSCACGYTQGVCANKGGGEQCYANGQCSSNVCNGGSPNNPGTCTGAAQCPGGTGPTPPACNLTTSQIVENPPGCFGCVAKPNVNCYVAEFNCNVRTIYSPTCENAFGHYETQQACQQALGGTTCWRLAETSGTFSCSQQPVQNVSMCNGADVSVAGQTFNYYTTQALCNVAADAKNGTGGTTNINCFNVLSNCAVEVKPRPAQPGQGGSYCAAVAPTGAYYDNLQTCLSNKTGLKIGAGEQCPSARGCVCASGPDKDKAIGTGARCAAYKANGQACEAGYECRTSYCDFTSVQPGGAGRCADIPNSMQPCSQVTTPHVCSGRPDCHWTGSACAPGGPNRPGSGALMCPNGGVETASQFIKFTCPQGCSLTTEADGVTAWRCYGNPEYSTTPPSALNQQTECGQIDVLNAQGNYCGILTIGGAAQYTCDQARCQPQSTPSPTPPVSPPPSSISCGGITPIDPTTLQPLSTVTAGQQVRFRCSAAGGITPNYFFFTYRTNSSGALELFHSNASDVTGIMTVTDYLHVQCNPCVGTTCASAQSVNQSCNYEFRKATPPGPQCLALWMASSQNPTIPLTNPKVGDKILLGCGQVPGAARYIFRVTEPDGTVVKLNALDAQTAPRTSQEYAITKEGRHYAQCQICTGQAESTCLEYEPLAPPTQGIN